MNFFISDALAQSGGESGGFLSLIPLILIFVLFYFLLIRPQQKRAKKHKLLVESLKVGDEVVTSGGIVGRITVLQGPAEKEAGGQVINYVAMETQSGVSMFVQRDAVTQLLPADTIDEFRSWADRKASKGKRKKKSAARLQRDKPESSNDDSSAD